MIRFAVVGTNNITDAFIDAAHQSGQMILSAVYSRSLPQAQQYAQRYGVSTCFDSLPVMAAYEGIDAVYIASPNSLHCEQTLLFLSSGKHVLCEKPLASNLQEAEAVVACAKKHQRVVLEAYKNCWMPNFSHVQNLLPQLGKIHKAFFTYCQYSSRYQRYLDGENPNTFNPLFSNGSIMDIGYYCVAAAVALWGAPKSIQANAHLLPSGVDAHGTVILDYADFDVTLSHSKVSDSQLLSEIQGEQGSLTIGAHPMFSRLWHNARGQVAQEVSLPQAENSMLYEAQAFVRLIE
ncbi:MAG: Gfo/Idh/MocA family protein, partial [Enterobacteriaceae bacterium]